VDCAGFAPDSFGNSAWFPSRLCAKAKAGNV
jgi:hypothetical protein